MSHSQTKNMGTSNLWVKQLQVLSMLPDGGAGAGRHRSLGQERPSMEVLGRCQGASNGS